MAFQLDTAELPGDAIEVARIGDAWGVKGWLKVIAFSPDPEALFSSKQWFLQPSERGPKVFDGTLLMRVREAKEHSGTVVALVNGVDDRDSAQSLRGARVFVRRSSFPTTSGDEYYWVDLIGLEVVNREGEALGTVTELLQTSAQAVLVMQYTVGGEVHDRMIPFVAVYIDAVDIEGGCITVDWQADY
jgi:16S rRNA processing protein RimM